MEFVFQVKEIAEPGCMGNLLDKKSGGQGYPDSQVRVESVNRLVIQGKCIRYENNHPTPDSRTRKWAETQEVHVSDGTTVKMYFRPAGEGVTRQNAFGTINAAKGKPVGTQLILLPMMFAVRGADPETCLSSMSDPQWTASVVTTVGNDRWDGFQKKVGSRAAVQLWTAAKWDHSLVRYRRLDGDRVASQVDVISRVDPSLGLYLPAEWKQTQLDDKGRVRRSFAVTVQSVKVSGEVPKSEFELTFPSGM